MAEPLSENKENKEKLEKIHSDVKAPHIGYKYFESKEYLNMIPEDNPNWIYSELDIKQNQYDSSGLDNFTPPKCDTQHPFYNDIMTALNIFKEWRNLKESNNKNDKNSWKFLKRVNNKLDIYWTRIGNETISAIKSRMIVPYSVPIITGIINNDEQRCKYDTMIEQQQQIQNLSANNLIWHCNVKKPIAFITSRDMLTVRFIYILANAEVICGERSIKNHPNDEWINNKKYVRADCTLNLWHIRPYYAKKNTHSLVTYYAHLKPNGYIPQWLVDQKIAQKAQTILTVKKYIDSIKNVLHKKEILYIPHPLMKMMKVFNGGDDKKPEAEAKEEEEVAEVPEEAEPIPKEEAKKKHQQVIILENEHLRHRSVTLVTENNNEFIKFLKKLLKSKLNEKIWNKCDPNNTEKIETEKFMYFWTLPVTLFKVAIFQRKNGNKQKAKIDQKELKKDFMHLTTWIVRRYGQKQSDGGAIFVLTKANFAKNIVDYVKSYADAKGELYEQY